MTVYCERANSFERSVFQGYVDKYVVLYGASVAWFYMCCVTVVCGTFFISDPFPTSAEYPFRVDYEPLRTIVFAQQALAGFQCSAILCTNVLCALLLLFAGARFEILMNDLRAVKNPHSLIRCIKKYYDVKRYGTISRGERITQDKEGAVSDARRKWRMWLGSPLSSRCAFVASKACSAVSLLSG